MTWDGILWWAETHPHEIEAGLLVLRYVAIFLLITAIFDFLFGGPDDPDAFV